MRTEYEVEKHLEYYEKEKLNFTDSNQKFVAGVISALKWVLEGKDNKYPPIEELQKRADMLLEPEQAIDFKE